MPRLFLAVDLPPDVRESLAALAVPMAGARFVPAAQMHVTVRFLGSQPDPTPLADALAGLPAPAFTLAIAGVGTFGSAVLWAGVSPEPPLQALKAQVDERLGPDPESALHPFTPHLTLARLRAPNRRAIDDFLAQHRALISRAWTVEAFHLYESRTLAKGPVYTRLASFPLTRA